MLFPSMMPPRTPETSTKETELQWGFAAVRSRAYACTPPKTSGEAGDVDTFAFVPFFDLINHGEVDGDGGLLEGSNVDLHARPETSSFELYASRNLKGGEEILTCYKPRMENMLMFALFGFVPTGGNPHDRIDVMHRPHTVFPSAHGQCYSLLSVLALCSCRQLYRCHRAVLTPVFVHIDAVCRRPRPEQGRGHAGCKRPDRVFSWGLCAQLAHANVCRCCFASDAGRRGSTQNRCLDPPRSSAGSAECVQDHAGGGRSNAYKGWVRGREAGECGEVQA